MSGLYPYTDQYRDDESGLMYYNSRYYDTDLKRFTSIDPWAGDITNPQSLNKYSYVVNNPLKYNDPSGEVFETAWDGLNVLADFGAIAYNGVQEIGYAGVALYGTATGNDGLTDHALSAAAHNHQQIKGNLTDLAVDGAAAMIPFVPAGLTKIDDGAGFVQKHATEYDSKGEVIRRTPNNIQDKMTLDAAKNGSGDRIIQGLGDPKYKGMDKYEYEVKSDRGVISNVHYVKDPKAGNQFDHKFIDRELKNLNDKR